MEFPFESGHHNLSCGKITQGSVVSETRVRRRNHENENDEIHRCWDEKSLRSRRKKNWLPQSISSFVR